MRMWACHVDTRCHRVQDSVTAARLSHFLPDAIELARQGEAVHFGLPAQQLQALRSAFALSRSLNISFVGAAAGAANAAARVGMLEDLARALDAAAPAADGVRDCVLVIGEKDGVDALGRAWLSHAAPATWPAGLRRLDMALARTRRAHVARVRKDEAATARALGVAAVFASDHLTLSTLYTDCLARLATDTAAGIERLDVRHISLYVVEPTAAESAVVPLPGGVVQVRADCSAAQLSSELAAHAPRAAEQLRELAEKEAESAELSKHVERVLRLRRLARDGVLTHVQFTSGCWRLIRHRDTLERYVESSTLRVSDRNEIVPGAHVIDIAWNFIV